MYLTLYANEKGEVLEHPNLQMLGRSGNGWVIPQENEMMPLPKGASLVSVPEHFPVGLGNNDDIKLIKSDPHCKEHKVYAVAALLPQGFTRTLLPAGVKAYSQAELPLFGYAAVGLKGDTIYAAAVQSDEHRKWHPVYYNTEGLPARINKMLNKFPENRILRQLARCSLEYSCFTAQNIFYQRWEGGIPTMTACNAGCIGCISESHAGVDSPQNRLNFRPSVEEISQMGTEHLENAREAIISFGQGCEGEPSLNAHNLSQAIREIRSRTDKGTINMNTNAGYTEGIKAMADAGMDAMRVTIFSCIDKHYNIYHRPINYNLSNVKQSINYALDKGLRVSLNLLTFPGFTDREEEIEALLDFIRENPINMIQLRNLNIDPELIMSHFESSAEGIGIPDFIRVLKEELPQVEIGSYSHPVR